MTIQEKTKEALLDFKAGIEKMTLAQYMEQSMTITAIVFWDGFNKRFKLKNCNVFNKKTALQKIDEAISKTNWHIKRELPAMSEIFDKIKVSEKVKEIVDDTAKAVDRAYWLGYNDAQADHARQVREMMEGLKYHSKAKFMCDIDNIINSYLDNLTPKENATEGGRTKDYSDF